MKKKLLLAAMLFVMTVTACVPYNTGNDASDTDTSTFLSSDRNRYF